jgi:hypothetical protein
MVPIPSSPRGRDHSPLSEPYSALDTPRLFQVEVISANATAGSRQIGTSDTTQGTRHRISPRCSRSAGTQGNGRRPRWSSGRLIHSSAGSVTTGRSKCSRSRLETRHFIGDGVLICYVVSAPDGSGSVRAYDAGFNSSLASTTLVSRHLTQFR